MPTRSTYILLLVIGCGGPSWDGDGSGRSTGPASETGTAADTDETVPSVDAGAAADEADAGTLDDGYDDGYADAPAVDDGELGAEWRERLAERREDYSAALRVASLRLRGDLPTLLEIRFVAEAADPREAYESLIASFLEDPRFTRRLLELWRDTFKIGGDSELDSAPLFATQLAIEDRSMNELFTATSGNCPSFDRESGTIVPGDCDNGVPVHAGVLTNPGVMKHFYSNLAFRRVRWVQETFDCTAFPAEYGDPVDVGGAAPYTAPWPFESIAGAATGGRIDFLDTSSVVCANCHATMNHIAPLFGPFDADGMWQGTYAVTLPSDGLPLVEHGDWLPAGEETAWRYGVPAPDLPALGAAMAADPDVAQCTVARMWNWALGKGDIVLTLRTVPESVIADYVADYVAGGHQLRPLLFEVFTSDDFVRF